MKKAIEVKNIANRGIVIMMNEVIPGVTAGEISNISESTLHRMTELEHEITTVLLDIQHDILKDQ